MATLTVDMIAKYLNDNDSGRGTCKDVAYALDIFLSDFGKSGCVRALIAYAEQDRLHSPNVHWVQELRKQLVSYDRARDMIYIIPI
jgi:hypothetical protein